MSKHALDRYPHLRDMVAPDRAAAPSRGPRGMTGRGRIEQSIINYPKERAIPMVRYRPVMMLRGISKVVAIAFATSQIVRAAFAYVAQQIDVGVSPQTISLFSCVTCGLVSLWLQSDARRAFGFARDKGYVKTADDPSQGPQVAPDCPKRWLVMLHIELNPAAAGA